MKCRVIKYTLILVVLLSYLRVQGQSTHCSDDCSCSAEGKVIDGASSLPIPFAAIQIKDSKIGTSADENGNFKLTNICDEEFDIIITSIGYKTLVHHHDNFHDFIEVRLASEEIILESIVVEGKRENTSGTSSSVVSTLSGKGLSHLKSESLGNVLGSITGVNTLKNGHNVVKPIIHGLHSNRVLIINNGIRHEGQEWGQDHAPEIDPSIVNRLSVVKGASAVQYGPNALGGVIIIEPPRLELNSHLHGEITIKGESNGRAMDGTMLLQQGYEKIAFLVQASGRNQGDLSAPNYVLSNTGMKEYSVALGMRFHHKHIDLQTYYSQLNQKLGILRGSVVGNLTDLAQAIEASIPENTSSFGYTINNPNQQVNHQMLKIGGNYNMHESQLQFQYGLQKNLRKEFDVRRGSNNDIPSINLELITQSLETKWLHPNIGQWIGNIGAQWLYQDNNNLPGTNTNSFIPNYNVTRVGIFAVEERDFNEFKFEIGARYDYQYNYARGRDQAGETYIDKATYNSLSGLLGFSKNVSQNSNLRLNVSSAWRAPNVAELYSFGKHGSTIQYGALRFEKDGNGNYLAQVLTQNQKQINNELGLKWVTVFTHTTEKINLEITPYVNYIANYFYLKPAGITSTVRGAFPFFIYDQTNALLAGADFTLIYNHNQLWKSKITGAYLYAKDVLNHDNLINLPANKLGYELSFSKKIWRFNNLDFDIMPSYTFEQKMNPTRIISPKDLVVAEESGTNLFENDTSNFDFKDAPNGYFLLDANIGVSMKKVGLGIRIKNVLNTTYRDYTNQMRYYADEVGVNGTFYIKIQL